MEVGSRLRVAKNSEGVMPKESSGEGGVQHIEMCSCGGSGGWMKRELYVIHPPDTWRWGVRGSLIIPQHLRTFGGGRHAGGEIFPFGDDCKRVTRCYIKGGGVGE